MLKEGLDFLRETTAEGGKVLFVGTKRQAEGSIRLEAMRAGQYYVNNRWLGGMLTNWKTVKKSIDRYNQLPRDARQSRGQARGALQEGAVEHDSRQVEKYAKTLEGIREDGSSTQTRSSSSTSARKSNRGPGGQAPPHPDRRRRRYELTAPAKHRLSSMPGNDDALRAIDLYCTAVANACIEGSEAHQAELVAQRASQPAKSKSEGGSSTGRRVVEIKQQPRRGRNQGERTAGGGKSYSAGGEKNEDKTSAAAAPEAPTATAPAAAPATPARRGSGRCGGCTRGRRQGIV